MRFDFIRTASTRSGRFLLSLPGIALLFGVLAGCYVVAWCHRFTADWGISLISATSVALAVSLAVELAWRKPKATSPNDSEVAAAWLFGLACLVPAAWNVTCGWLTQAVISVTARFSLETLSSPPLRLLLLFAAALMTLSVPIYALVRLPIYLDQLWGNRRFSKPRTGGESSSLPRCARFYALGLSLGIAADVLLLAPWVGVDMIGYAAALCSAGLFALVVIRATAMPRRAPLGPESEWSEVPATLSASTGSTHADSDTLQGLSATPETLAINRRVPRTAMAAVWSAGAIACLGVLAALAMRMTRQLMPAASFLIWAEWSSLILSLSAGMFWTARRQRRSGGDVRVAGADRTGSLWPAACLLAAGWCAALPLIFSWHVDGLLLVGAYVAPVWLGVAVRCLVAFSMLAPIGFSWGMLIAAIEPDSESPVLWRPAPRQGHAGETSGGFPQFSLFPFVAGLLLVRWIVLSRWDIGDVLPIVAALLAAGAIARWLPDRRLPRGWLRRLATLVPLCLVIASPFLRHRYDPARSARLLFSTQVFLAKRTGTEAKLLPFLDEGRLIARREGELSTYTVWKMRGAQLQIREGGVPKAIVSTDTRFCPQFSADVMQAALPLVLHERPRRVLLLGLQGGVTLGTCFDFPLKELTCVESDSAAIELFRDVIARTNRRSVPAQQNPLEDDRVRLLGLDPPLALLADDEPYDVILSCPDQSALAQSTPNFTLEFYRHAAARLASDGIFCQRFQYVDYGPEPLRAVVKTMQSAFRTVAAVETASGELALLGTNSPAGLLRDGLLSRVQSPHVRRVLSQAGWDWAVPLNLSAYDQSALAEFAAEGNAGDNTAAGGQLAFRLPLEMMRWGAKWQEIGEALAGRTGSLLKWSSDEDAHVALSRLEEITGQRNLIVRFPDQKWAYRKTLRERMKAGARTVVRQVKGAAPERRLHPEDRRRKEYLEALGAAVKRPDPENIRRIARFSQPYDPLVSFFLHDEVARLYSRAQHPDPQTELRHRLYLVYFTDPRDRSIRNIAAALKLLAEHPAAVPDPLDRRDHFDALLQMLKSRWHGRAAAPPIAKNVALGDVAQSVAASEAAFDVLPQLYRKCGLDESDWRSRRQVLERSLIRPLRTYRTQLLSQTRARKTPRKASANARRTGL